MHSTDQRARVSAGVGLRGRLAWMRDMPQELRAFLWVSGALEAAYYGVYLVVFNLYLLRLGIGPEFIGIALGSAVLAHSVSTYTFGRIGNRIAPRNQMIMGLATVFVGLVGVTVTDLLPHPAWRPWVLSFNCMAWVGGGQIMVSRLPYLRRHSPADRLVGLFSIEQILVAISAALGTGLMLTATQVVPALMEVSSDDPAPFRFGLLVAPLLIAIGFIKFRAQTKKLDQSSLDQPDLHREKNVYEEGDGTSSALADGASVPGLSTTAVILILAAYNILLRLGIATTDFWNVYVDAGLGSNPSTVAVVMGVGHIAAIPSAMALPWLTERWSTRTLVGLGTLSLALISVPLALIPEVLVAGLAYLTILFVAKGIEVTFEVYRISAVPAGHVFRMEGIIYSMRGLMRAGYMVAGGYLIAWAGFGLLFLLGGIFYLLAATTLFGFAPPANNYDDEPQTPTSASPALR